MKREELRRRILARYKTLGDWSKETGVTQSSVSQIVMGKSNLPHDGVVMYCDKLGIKRGEIGDLFYPEVKE